MPQQTYAVTLGTLQIRSNVPIPPELRKAMVDVVKDVLRNDGKGTTGPNGEEIEICLIEVG